MKQKRGILLSPFILMMAAAALLGILAGFYQFAAFLFGAALILTMLGALFVCIVFWWQSNDNRPWWRLVLRAFATSLVLVGALGFFGSAASSWHLLNWLPRSFEWPISGTVHALRLSSGEYVVPLYGSGRVQIYDHDLDFVRGWPINADGGSFALSLSPEPTSFEVYTARGSNWYEYDVMGDLVAADTYPGELPQSYSNTTLEGKGNPIFWPFTHPFRAWAVLAVGLMLILATDKPRSR